MLVELAILLASCDATGAALGVCSSQCPAGEAASYTICAVEKRQSTSTKKSTVPTPKPMRLCSYYVNGTIDIPTSSVITSWIEVGSRQCIGDPPPPEPVVQRRSVEGEARDAFTAAATYPLAYLNPAGEVEVTQVVNFGVNPGGGTHTGSLFGESAEIRFTPSSVSWRFSDGQSKSGRFVSSSFSEPQLISATATVFYRIDYRYPATDWVIGASSAQLDSNRLSLSVIDPPRRTLLRD